jgi:hypothetical protein
MSREQRRLLEEFSRLEAKDGDEDDRGIINKVKDIFS